MKALPLMVFAKKIMIFAIFNPWKLANNNFSFPDYLDLPHFFFEALRNPLWLSFWHKSIAFDGTHPKIIMIFAVFNLCLQRGTTWSKSNTHYPDVAGMLFDPRRRHWKRKNFNLKIVVGISIVKNVFAQALCCHCPWSWKNQKRWRPKGKIACQNKALLDLC